MDSSQSAIKVGLLILVLAVAAVAGLYVVVAIKRWLNRDESIDTFSLQELRELKQRGELTPAEFEALRGEIIASAGRTPPKPANEKRPPPADGDSSIDGTFGSDL